MPPLKDKVQGQGARTNQTGRLGRRCWLPLPGLVGLCRQQTHTHVEDVTVLKFDLCPPRSTAAVIGYAATFPPSQMQPNLSTHTCFMYTDLPDALGPVINSMRGCSARMLLSAPAAASAPSVVSLSMKVPGASSSHSGWRPARKTSHQIFRSVCLASKLNSRRAWPREQQHAALPSVVDDHSNLDSRLTPATPINKTVLLPTGCSAHLLQCVSRSQPPAGACSTPAHVPLLPGCTSSRARQPRQRRPSARAQTAAGA